MTFEEYLGEAIKGWKNAHNDLSKIRSDARSDSHEWHTHALTKAGKESGMSDARRTHASEEEARAHVEKVNKLNPGRNYKYNLYKKGNHVGTI